MSDMDDVRRICTATGISPLTAQRLLEEAEQLLGPRQQKQDSEGKTHEKDESAEFIKLCFKA
jgi:hypothetical protein